jgi:hypothetical protein
MAGNFFPEGDANGLLGSVAPEPEYLLILMSQQPPLVAGAAPHPPPVPFVPPPPPGPVPQQANAQAQYTNASKLYRSYQIALSELKEYMITSLDLSVHAVFEDPQYGVINLSPSVILQRMDLVYLRMSPEDSILMKLALSECLLDTPDRVMRGFIQNHLELHSLFATNGTVINDRDKYEYLRDAVSVVPYYADVVKSFRFIAPTRDLQTFVALSNVLQNAELNRPVMITAGSNGYANRVTTMITHPPRSVSPNASGTNGIVQESRTCHYCPVCAKWLPIVHPRCMSRYKPGDFIPKAPKK